MGKILQRDFLFWLTQHFFPIDCCENKTITMIIKKVYIVKNLEKNRNKFAVLYSFLKKKKNDKDAKHSLSFFYILKYSQND